MKKLLYTTVIFTGFLILFQEFIRQKTVEPFVFEENSKEISTKNSEFSKIIQSINKRNESINSIIVSEMPIKLKNSGFTFKLTGDLAFEKEKNFRLKITHRLTGKEMDLGSNQNIFWFWSKRIDPPALYFSKHENLSKTNLKSALNPTLMIESLNLNKIKIENINNTKINEKYLIIYEERISPTNESLDLATYIEITNNRINYKTLCYKDGRKIVTTNYKENKILYEYHEENTIMEWDLTNMKINSTIPSSYWDMPNMTKTIDIGNE